MKTLLLLIIFFGSLYSATSVDTRFDTATPTELQSNILLFKQRAFSFITDPTYAKIWFAGDEEELEHIVKSFVIAGHKFSACLSPLTSTFLEVLLLDQMVDLLFETEDESTKEENAPKKSFFKKRSFDRLSAISQDLFNKVCTLNKDKTPLSVIIKSPESFKKWCSTPQNAQFETVNCLLTQGTCAAENISSASKCGQFKVGFCIRENSQISRSSYLKLGMHHLQRHNTLPIFIIYPSEDRRNLRNPHILFNRQTTIHFGFSGLFWGDFIAASTAVNDLMLHQCSQLVFLNETDRFQNSGAFWHALSKNYPFVTTDETKRDFEKNFGLTNQLGPVLFSGDVLHPLVEFLFSELKRKGLSLPDFNKDIILKISNPHANSFVLHLHKIKDPFILFEQSNKGQLHLYYPSKEMIERDSSIAVMGLYNLFDICGRACVLGSCAAAPKNK